MKLIKLALLGVSAVAAVLSTSCGTLPERPEFKGPVSSESELPWAIRQPGEGQGALGGIGQ